MELLERLAAEGVAKGAVGDAAECAPDAGRASWLRRPWACRTDMTWVLEARSNRVRKGLPRRERKARRAMLAVQRT